MAETEDGLQLDNWHGGGSRTGLFVDELYRNPGCNGAQMSREFCDATQHVPEERAGGTRGDEGHR